MSRLSDNGTWPDAVLFAVANGLVDTDYSISTDLDGDLIVAASDGLGICLAYFRDGLLCLRSNPLLCRRAELSVMIESPTAPDQIGEFLRNLVRL